MRVVPGGGFDRGWSLRAESHTVTSITLSSSPRPYEFQLPEPIPPSMDGDRPSECWSLVLSPTALSGTLWIHGLRVLSTASTEIASAYRLPLWKQLFDPSTNRSPSDPSPGFATLHSHLDGTESSPTGHLVLESERILRVQPIAQTFVLPYNIFTVAPFGLHTDGPADPDWEKLVCITFWP